MGPQTVEVSGVGPCSPNRALLCPALHKSHVSSDRLRAPVQVGLRRSCRARASVLIVFPDGSESGQRSAAVQLRAEVGADVPPDISVVPPPTGRRLSPVPHPTGPEPAFIGPGSLLAPPTGSGDTFEGLRALKPAAPTAGMSRLRTSGFFTAIVHIQKPKGP